MNGISCSLVGRLPRDAGPLRYTNGGRAFLNFSLAVHDDRAEPGVTEWVRVGVFGELAEQLDGTLRAHQTITVEGRLRLTAWVDPEGIERPTLSVAAWDVQHGTQPRRATSRHHQEERPARRPRAMPEGVAVTGRHRTPKETRRLLGLDDHDEGPTRAPGARRGKHAE